MAVKDSDVVITDTWISMGTNESNKIISDFQNYQVNKLLMSNANSNAIFLHCLPAHRGQEVSDEIIDGPQSLVWEQSYNRLFIQKAIMLWCLKKNE